MGLRRYNNNNNRLQLSKTSASKKGSRVFGILLLIWAGVLIFILFQNSSEASSLNWLNIQDSAGIIFIVAFSALLLISAYFLLTAKEKVFDDTDRHTHSLWPLAKNAVRFGGTILLLLIPFTLLLFAMDDDSTFRIFGGIVIGIFWIAMIFLGIDIIQKIKRYKKFGVSVLISDKSSYKPGEVVKLKLYNDKLNGQELIYSLQNIHEFWEGGGSDDSPTLRYETLFVTTKTGAVEQNIEFTIPRGNTKPTCYNYTEPIYWSVEVYDNNEYFSQFIINVWD
jgi:hypothetical protein